MLSWQPTESIKITKIKNGMTMNINKNIKTTKQKIIKTENW